MRRFAFATSISLFALLSACSSTADDVAQADDDYTVQPTGGSASITVNGFTPSATTHVYLEKEQTGGAGRVVVQPGVAIPVSPGAYCIFALSEGIETNRHCGIEIPTLSALTYTMGRLQITRSCTDDLFNVDVLAESPSSTTASYVRRGQQIAKTTAPLAHPAGNADYALSYASGSSGANLLQKITARVDEGATTTVDICSTTGMATLRLLPPSQRDLPTHVPAYDAYRASIWTAEGTTGATAPFTELTKPLLFVVPAANGAALPRLRVTAYQAREWELAAPGQPIKEVQLGRLDVKHVAVTMPDGSIKEVEGKWAFVQPSGFVIADIPTGKGVDVFPGHYTIRIDYKHPLDGAPMTDTHVVDIP